MGVQTRLGIQDDTSQQHVTVPFVVLLFTCAVDHAWEHDRGEGHFWYADVTSGAKYEGRDRGAFNFDWRYRKRGLDL